MGLVAFAFVSSCNKDESKINTNLPSVSSEVSNLVDCSDIQLYNYENYGSLHNQILFEILTQASLDSSIDLTSQLNLYISEYHNSLTLQTYVNGEPRSTSVDIINRNNFSEELKNFSIEIIQHLYNTNGIVKPKTIVQHIKDKCHIFDF